MKITDEMVEKAAQGFRAKQSSIVQGVGLPYGTSLQDACIRSATEAIAPLIRSAALEEAARVADGTEQVMIDQPVMGLTMAHRPTATDIAARIRALKDKDTRTPTEGDLL